MSAYLFEQAAPLGREAFGLGGELQPLDRRHVVRDLVDQALLLELDLTACPMAAWSASTCRAHRAHQFAQLSESKTAS